MSRVSFEGIGQEMATFLAAEGTSPGQVVKVTQNGTVGPCQQGDPFCGLAVNVHSGFAGVVMGGFMELKTSGAVALGRASLCGDGSGGVKQAESGGTPCTVVETDSTRGTCVVWM